MATSERDPVEQQLVDDATRDHARAARRGQRVREFANRVVSELDAYGCVRDADRARVIIYGTLVDCLYGDQSVDVDPRP
jgi:hypothetical protein